MPPLALQFSFSLLAAIAVFVFVRFGWGTTRAWIARQEAWFDRVLNQQLLLEISPRIAFIGHMAAILMGAVIMLALLSDWIWAVVGGVLGYFVPYLLVRHQEQRRREKLEQQLVDGIMTMVAGVRAGLNLIQSMELIVANHDGPIKQEFSQLLREYAMGLDLNQAMRNASNRIGLQNYRLLFTAVEMHRLRGGDAGQSLERIAESIREIQRLEGKLDALTSQGRFQARMMAVMPFFIMGVFYIIDPTGVAMLFTEATGRLMLLASCTLILIGFLWIRKIMSVDI